MANIIIILPIEKFSSIRMNVLGVLATDVCVNEEHLILNVVYDTSYTNSQEIEQHVRSQGC